jgi:transcriptional regulator with XRE-family HTH domain
MGMANEIMAQTIREARQRAGLSQVGLAVIAGVHPSTVCLLERGARVADETLAKVAQALGLTVARAGATPQASLDDSARLRLARMELGEIRVFVTMEIGGGSRTACVICGGLGNHREDFVAGGRRFGPCPVVELYAKLDHLGYETLSEKGRGSP